MRQKPLAAATPIPIVGGRGNWQIPLAGLIFDTFWKRLALMDFPGTQNMFENLFRFVDHSIRERDLLIDALNADKRDDDYQAKLKAFNNGKVSGHAPIGRTIKLISDINLPFGFGERDKAYQAATAEAIQSGLGLHVLPKLEAANAAHWELCSQAMEMADEFAGCERLTYITAHFEVFNALTNLANSRTPKPDTASPVEDQGSGTNLH